MVKNNIADNIASLKPDQIKLLNRALKFSVKRKRSNRDAIIIASIGKTQLSCIIPWNCSKDNGLKSATVLENNFSVRNELTLSSRFFNPAASREWFSGTKPLTLTCRHFSPSDGEAIAEALEKERRARLPVSGDRMDSLLADAEESLRGVGDGDGQLDGCPVACDVGVREPVGGGQVGVVVKGVALGVDGLETQLKNAP